MQNDNKYDFLKLENQLCFPLYAAARETVKKYYPYLEKAGLTYTQYIAMMVLWEEKEISVKDLGKKLYLDSGTLTPVLKNLEAKGFIKRTRSKKDERIIIASLTEKGEGLREQVSDIPEKVGSCIPLSADEAKTLYSLLYKILKG